MSGDIEVTVNEGPNQGQNQGQNEPPVSFVETDGETLVHVGEDPSGESKGRVSNDEERWRQAEANQARLAAGFDDLRSRLTGGNTGAPAAAAPDPYKAHEDALADRERALGIQWEAHKAARTFTPELLRDFDQKAREINQERSNISARRAMGEMLPQILQASQAQQFQQEYADVRNNAAASRWARGHYDQLVATGAPDHPDTVRRAMNAARAQFRLGGYRMDPTDHDRAQHSGFSGNGRTSSNPKSNVVKMGKAEKGMAMSMYGDRFKGDEQKAYAQWARGPGVRAQKAAQAARRSRSNGGY